MLFQDKLKGHIHLLMHSNISTLFSIQCNYFKTPFMYSMSVGSVTLGRPAMDGCVENYWRLILSVCLQHHFCPKAQINVYN